MRYAHELWLLIDVTITVALVCALMSSPTHAKPKPEPANEGILVRSGPTETQPVAAWPDPIEDKVPGSCQVGPTIYAVWRPQCDR